MAWNVVLRVVFLIFFSILVADPAAAKRLALVIGNADYPSNPLQTPVQDAEDMTAKLEKLDFEVITINEGNLSLSEMRGALEELKNRPKDVEAVLFYFAGHGLQFRGQNFLIPAQVDLSSAEEIPSKAFGLDEVLEVLWDFETASKIVILDACRDYPFDGDPGLAKPVQTPGGTLTLFATRPDGRARDGGPLDRNSPFTKALLYFITEPGLELKDLAFEVRKAVMVDTGDFQTPWEDGAPLAAFYFSPPAMIEGRILEADDDALVLINGEEVMHSSENDKEWIPLKPGDNRLVIKIFNQSTFQGGCNWFREIFEQYRSQLIWLAARGIMPGADF
jgi:hypothetical protein